MLDRIHTAISNQSADLEEKISRLKRAKNKIETEQNTSLEEIKKIRNPSLVSSWQGSRSETLLSQEMKHTMRCKTS
ncbi:DUF5082 family protein [Bacillus swezeyi]